MTRLRALIDSPLHPATGRAVLLLAGAASFGLAVLVGLGRVGPGSTSSPHPETSARVRVGSPAIVPRSASPGAQRPQASSRPAQDPQDRPGTAAHRRAARELASHRALQHVPWRRAGVSISLVGTRRGKAVLAVEGPGLAADRRAYHRFLHSFHDGGDAYLPSLRTRGGRR